MSSDLPLSLGIDLGTSSTKAVLVDTAGRLVAQARASYPIISDRQGWAESDPDQWWAAVVTAVREVVAAGGRAPFAIGLSGQMHGLVLTDESGTPVRNALLWADSRALDRLGAYRGLDAEFRRRLANPLVPGMTGPLLSWVAEHEPRLYARAAWAVQPKDWLRQRLTGHAGAEPSDASATLLYDIPRECWYTELVRALGLDQAMLAPLLPHSGSAAGTLRPEAAAMLRLPVGLPVAAGAADTAAAALGSGLFGSEQVQLTVGTGAQIVRPLPHPADLSASGVHVFRAAAPRGWYAMAATLNAGLSLNWVRETLSASWPEMYASLDASARTADPVFVPHLAGERTPYLDSDLRGSWTGLSLAHDRTALLRSALEGVAFAAREALDALVGDRRPRRLRVAGGGTLAPGWRQLLADVLDLPLDAMDVPAASARGAALLGARAAELVTFEDIEGALAPPVRQVAEPSAPDPARRDRQARFHQVIMKLQPAADRHHADPERSTGGLIT